jgi:FkbM family methyltransferase
MSAMLPVILGKMHWWASRSQWLFPAVVKISNQCQAIIRSRLNDGIDPTRNGEFLLLSLLAPGAKTFIDVGANIGTWSKEFAKLIADRNGYGVLFEPSSIAFRRLCEKRNEFACRIDIVQAALGDTIGEATFFMEPEAGETSSLVPGFSRPAATAIKVPVTTIDHEIGKRGLGLVDFIKVDAEGFDLKVLKGAARMLRQKQIGVVQFEYNAPWAEAGSTLAEARRYLEGMGYELFLLKGDGLYSPQFQRYGEYFGYSNYVAVSPHCTARIEGLRREQI